MEAENTKAILWDLNGVIIDDMEVHFHAFQRYLRDIGLDMTRDYFVDYCTGTPPNEVFGKLFSDNDCDISIDEATEKKRDYYFEVLAGRMVMLPGVLKLLESAREIGWRQAVASGATKIEVATIVAGFGIGEYFGALVASEDVKRGKPDPEPFMLAADKLGVGYENCVVIEDGEYGLRAANAAGMRSIGVTNTQDAQSLASADVVVKSLEEVDMKLLEELTSYTR